MGYAITIEGIVIAALAITKIYDVKNPGSVYTKYIALVGVVILACITGFEFDAYYVRFMAAIPCISAVLFFDNKYTKIAGSLFMAINIFLNVYKIAMLFQPTNWMQSACNTKGVLGILVRNLYGSIR